MIAAAMPSHLPGVLHALEPTLNQFGYLAVVGLVLIEDFGVPVPGETVGFAIGHVFNAIGVALWVGVWVCVGYLSGSHINPIYHDASRYSTFLAIALGALLLAYIARRVLQARRARVPNVT